MNAIYKTEQGGQEVLRRYKDILSAWPVENKQYHVDTRFGSTFVIESGSAAKPPLILIHGSAVNSFAWAGDVATFSQSHRVFAVDIIGEAGLSDPNRPAYQSGHYAEWLAELFDKLGLEKTSLVGISLGGWMALSFATTYPEKVEKLSLICPGGIARERRSFIFKAVFYSLWGSWGQKQILKIVNGGKHPPATGPGVEAGTNFMALIHTHFKPRMEKLSLFTDQALSRLTMPVQIIFGELDYLIPAEESIAKLKCFAPEIDIVLLADTGHMIANQARRIQAFLT